MWLKKIVEHKTTMILILIIILSGMLYYVNTQNTREKFEIDNKIIIDKLEFKIFYTNWCGWSKRALATINSDEFKNKFQEVKDKANIVLVECDGAGKEECAKRQIRGYPTMQLCKGEKTIEFNGDRTPDGIIDFIKQNQDRL